MASTWNASVTLIDADQKTSTLQAKFTLAGLTLAADFDDASAALTAWITDIKAVSDANVLSSRLTVLDQGGIDGTIPANESDVSDEIVLVCHTNDTGFPNELATLRVPAPSDDVFVNADPAQGGDLADAALQDYVDNFATSGTLMFSDGEQVNTAEGTHGMADAFWRSKATQIR